MYDCQMENNWTDCLPVSKGILSFNDANTFEGSCNVLKNDENDIIGIIDGRSLVGT